MFKWTEFWYGTALLFKQLKIWLTRDFSFLLFGTIPLRLVSLFVCWELFKCMEIFAWAWSRGVMGTAELSLFCPVIVRGFFHFNWKRKFHDIFYLVFLILIPQVWTKIFIHYLLNISENVQALKENSLIPPIYNIID